MQYTVVSVSARYTTLNTDHFWSVDTVNGFALAQWFLAGFLCGLDIYWQTIDKGVSPEAFQCSLTHNKENLMSFAVLPPTREDRLMSSLRSEGMCRSRVVNI